MWPHELSAVIGLGQLSLEFGRVERITYHEDGITPESDTDHTVMLGLIGCAFAHAYLPELDLGKVAQLALVHDLVEVYAGDTPTLRISDAQRADKKSREDAALRRLGQMFGTTLPWIPQMIAEYERRETREARYVKALDKLLPKITHILNGLATIRAQGMGPVELTTRYEAQFVELQEYAADFPQLFELRAGLLEVLFERYPESVA